MRPVVVTEVLAAASANNICLSQTPLAAGNLTINGAAAAAGVATLDSPRVVGITSAGNETGRTFTVYGTDANGNAISEAVIGADTGVASTVLNFKTVTRISVDAATADAITAGTTTVGASNWIPVDYIQSPMNLGFGCVVSGTVNYTIQHTFDNVFDPTVTPTAFDHPYVAAQTANADGNYSAAIRAMRVKINSGSGTVTTTILQGLTS